MTPQDRIGALIDAAQAAIAAHAEELTALDSAIGDADHGINMKRGFEAIAAERAALVDKSLPEALKAAGMKLVMTVGGASGPLYGTLLMTIGKEMEAGGDLAAALRKAAEAVGARGKSHAGQKTMLDVLIPVADALGAGSDPAQIAAVAHAASQATVPLKAERGRASFLGDRSVGHMDPGARSCALLVEAVAKVMEDKA
jgi:dihydroxyacetone kinase-like protein